MGRLKGLRVRLRSVAQRGRVEEEMDEEFRFHLEMETERLIASGLTPEEARRRAFLSFGGVTQHKESMREGRSIPLLESLYRDLRIAARGLRRSPGLAIAATVSLGLAIGLNTAMFSLANVLLFKPLPGPVGKRLVHVSILRSGERVGIGYRDFREYQERTRTLEELAAYTVAAPVIRWKDQGLGSGQVQLVSSNFFSALGALPERGRFFLPDEDRTPGTSPVVVISHHFWQTEMEGEAEPVGEMLELNGEAFTIVGVAPAGFVGAMPPQAFDVFVPMMMRSTVTGRPPLELTRDGGGPDWGRLIGRVRRGSSPNQVAAELTAISAGLARERADSDQGKERVEVRPVRGIIPEVQEGLLPNLLFVMGMVGLVLLVACSNVAGLLLARAAARRQEIAIRLSLGAGRLVLIRQLLVESLLLALGGGVLGLALSARGAPTLQALMGVPEGARVEMDFTSDWRVLAFTAAVALGSAVLFGLVPALRATRQDLRPALQREAPAYRQRWRLGSGVVVAQVAFSVVLVLAAGVLVRQVAPSLWTNPGFATSAVLHVGVSSGLQAENPASRQGRLDALVQRLESRPEIARVEMGTATLMGCCGPEVALRLPGEEPTDPAVERTVAFNVASKGLIEMLEIPLVRGRGFDKRDSDGAPRVAVVNRALAARLWPDRDPLGQRIQLGPPFEDRTYEVVGVLENARYVADRKKDSPYLFLPLEQNRSRAGAVGLYVQARNGDTRSLIPLVQREARSLDASLTIRAASLSDVMNEALHAQRVFGNLFGVCAMIALLLSALGTYALLGFTVARRTREIGIRMALGAQQSQVRGTVVCQGLGLVALGTVLGFAPGYLGARGLGKMFGGGDPADPLSFAAVTLLLLLVAALASWLAARRATRVDPMVALRVE